MLEDIKNSVYDKLYFRLRSLKSSGKNVKFCIFE